jgi:hypothetical protein
LFKEEGMNIKLCRVSVMICSLLSLIPALSGFAQQNPDASKTDQPSTAKQSEAVRDGSHDFDFIYGKWRMPNHRLKKRLAGSHEWVDFVTCDEGSPLPGGIGDIDYWKARYWKDFVGVTVRTYDPKTGLWRIYWVDNTFSGGTIQPPVVGKFDGNLGIFEGPDTFNGIPIIVRYTWRVNPKGSQVVAKWEQAFSTDSGKTWETNWYNEFIHDDNCTPTS